MSTAGGCRPNHSQHAPVLGGKEIPLDFYPQHGSIQLEKLPLGTDSVIWSRGDSVSRPSGDVTGNKVRVIGNPKVVSVCFDRRAWDRVSIMDVIIQIILMPESKKQESFHPAGRPFISFSQWDRRGLHGEPTSVDLLKKLLFLNKNLTKFAFLHLQYHGIMQLQVEDDTSPSRKGRKANIHVVSRGVEQRAPRSKNREKTLKPGGRGGTKVTLCSCLCTDSASMVTVNHLCALKEPPVAAERSVPKPCTPELMGLLHLNQSTNQLLHCNGVSWKPWTPTDQVGTF